MYIHGVCFEYADDVVLCCLQDDYRKAVEEYDEKIYFSLKLICVELRNTYVRNCDDRTYIRVVSIIIEACILANTFTTLVISPT